MVPSPSSSAGARRALILSPGSACRVRRVSGPDGAGRDAERSRGSAGGRLHAAARPRATSVIRAQRPSPRSTDRSAHPSLRQQLLNPPVPRPVAPVVQVKLPVPLVPDVPPLVDQHEARPVPDAVQVPGLRVVVLRVGVLDPVLPRAPAPRSPGRARRRRAGTPACGCRSGQPWSRYFRSKSTSDGTCWCSCSR